MHWLNDRNAGYGDLYSLCKVKNFNEKLPPRFNISELPKNDADIYLIGDSFSGIARDFKHLPIQLGEKTGKKVDAIIASDVDIRFFYPQNYPRLIHSSRTRRKIVIIECVERQILTYYQNFTNYKPEEFVSTPYAKISELANKINIHLFSQAGAFYQFFFLNSPGFSSVTEFWNTFKFNRFGTIAKETPVYSKNPPFIFYFEDTKKDLVKSFYANHSDSVIKKTAENIAHIGKILHENFNAELIFIPVPNKYTIYHKFVNNDSYDQFLPKLQTALELRGVVVVDLYHPFVNSNELLYYPTDTHWNRRGIQIAVEQTKKTLDRISINQN